MASVHISQLKKIMGKILIQILKLDFFILILHILLTGNLSTLMPQECYDFAKVLGLEKFFSLESLESFEQGKLLCTSNFEKIHDLTQMNTDYAENTDKYKQCKAFFQKILSFLKPIS